MEIIFTEPSDQTAKNSSSVFLSGFPEQTSNDPQIKTRLPEKLTEHMKSCFLRNRSNEFMVIVFSENKTLYPHFGFSSKCILI